MQFPKRFQRRVMAVLLETRSSSIVKAVCCFPFIDLKSGCFPHSAPSWVLLPSYSVSWMFFTFSKWNSLEIYKLLPSNSIALNERAQKMQEAGSWERAESALYSVSGDLDNRGDPLTAPSPPFLVYKRKRLKMLFKIVYSSSLYLPTIHQVLLVHVTNFFLLAYCVPAAL